MFRDAKEAFREAHVNSTSTTIGNNNSGGGLRRASTQPETSLGKAALGGRGPDRRRASVGKAGGALGLKEFMHRARVLSLYRGILKVWAGATAPAALLPYERTCCLNRAPGRFRELLFEYVRTLSSVSYCTYVLGTFLLLLRRLCTE